MAAKEGKDKPKDDGWKEAKMIRSADGTYEECLRDGTTKEFGRELTTAEVDVLIAAMFETEKAGLKGAAKKSLIDRRMKESGSDVRWGPNIVAVKPLKRS